VYITSPEAWYRFKRSTLLGGDDGLVGNPTTMLERAAAIMNHKLTIEVIERGKLGVRFLSRVFGPDVWTGDTASMCDLPRQLAKFHTTPNLPADVTPITKLILKAQSYHLTDANTPVIGALCRNVLRLAPQGVVAPQGIVDAVSRWGDDVPQEVQWPNPPDRQFYIDVCQTSLATLTQIVAFEETISDFTELGQFLELPLLVEPEVLRHETEPIVVDGVVEEPSNPPQRRVRRGGRRRQRRVLGAEGSLAPIGSQ
jgi:hypothetical protein